MSETAMRAALERIADMSGKTLLGCACDGDGYPHCCAQDVRRAHERGANRAFEDAAAIAKEALSSRNEGAKP